MLDYQLREEHFLVIETTAEAVKGGSADPSALPKVNIRFDSSPFTNGAITDWAMLECAWKKCLLELNVKRSRNHSPVLLSLPSTMCRSEMEMVVKIFFEKFNVPGFYLADYSLMSFYGYGQHLTGMALHISNDCSYVVPVIDSIPQYNAIVKTGIGYEHIREYVVKSLKQTNSIAQHFTSGFPPEFINHVMYHVCEFSTSPLEADGKKKDISNVNFKYADKEFTLGEIRLKAYELLFSPKLNNLRCASISELFLLALQKCDVDKRMQLFGHVTLLGRVTFVKGFRDRLVKEVKKLLPQSDFFSDMQPVDLKFPTSMPTYLEPYKSKDDHASFFGGILAAKLIFTDLKNYLSKLDYNELGPNVINVKGY